MALSINKLEANEGGAGYYDPGFTRYLESYLMHLKGLANNQMHPVDSHTLYKYEGDLYGLFDVLGIPRHLHWITMRMNNFTSPTQFNGELYTIIAPTEGVINNILQKFTTTKK